MICNNITNVAHSIINHQINILYNNTNSLFNYLFKSLDYNIYYYNDIVSSYYYDMMIVNDFLSYHSGGETFSHKYHIKPLLFLHGPPPASFKKEDLALVHQNTKKVHKIIFGQNIADLWRFKSDNKYITIMDYGLPTVDKSNNRDKSILILNLDNNSNMNRLQEHIKNHIGYCDILDHLPSYWSLNEVCNLLSQYKICIDVSYSINSLIAASCGCQCISPHILPKNKLISSINDFGNIINIIQILLNMNLSEDEREYNKTLLASTFDYNTFVDKLSHKIKSLKEQELFFV